MKRVISIINAIVPLAVIWYFVLVPNASAQTTQLQQTGPDHCVVNGCVNAPLIDGETFSWSDTLHYLGNYPILGKLAFRGLNSDMSGQATNTTGGQAIDESTVQNNGFAVHALFDSDCFRCAESWDEGYLQVPNEYVASDPGLYGWNGAKNVTSGTGQVGLVTATPSQAQTVTLTSSDPTQVQVPTSVTILAGSLDANFTITATAPTQPNSPPYLTEAFVTITATFPDGHAATTTVGVEPLPAPTPPDSMLRPFYPCGSNQHNCLKPGGCWWDGKGAGWQNIQCQPRPTYWISEAMVKLER